MSEQDRTPIVDKLLDDITADCEGDFWQEDATEDQVARIVEAARQLERDGYQARIDACLDSKRLIDDKMKFFERVTVLETSLADARAALRECKPFLMRAGFVLKSDSAARLALVEKLDNLLAKSQP